VGPELLKDLLLCAKVRLPIKHSEVFMEIKMYEHEDPESETTSVYTTS
jgi:hypothetical protein